MFEFSTLFRKASIIQDLPKVGDTIYVQTLCFGWQEAVIKRFVLSPYYPECNQGIQRAYVLGQTKQGGYFSDYILIPNLPRLPVKVKDFDEALADDPDYNQYLHNLAEAEVEEDTGEDYEYDSWKDDRAASRFE